MSLVASAHPGPLVMPKLWQAALDDLEALERITVELQIFLELQYFFEGKPIATERKQPL